MNDETDFFKENGAFHVIEYHEKFGWDEPICSWNYGSLEYLDAIAKECLEKGKTGTELGYYKPYKKTPGSFFNELVY